MSMSNAMQHTGGPYPADLAQTLRAMAARDGLPEGADLAALATKVRGTRPGRFSPDGCQFPERHYFRGRWTYIGSDEDGLYATEVPFRLEGQP